MRQLVQRLNDPVHIAPVAVFRVLFGFVMLVGILRFMLNGWVYEQYIRPQFYFTYLGFDWIKPLPGMGMYIIFVLMALAALLVMLGLFYRWACVSFFLLFTYVELIDKANYLNHYYFVSLVSFLLIWVPAGRYFSLDVLRKPHIEINQVPCWIILVFKLQLGIVYFYAGAAKLNADWMLQALPLKIWLPVHMDMPLIGPLFQYTWLAFLFSWFGALYDLSIPFFLLYRRTRLWAYFAVIGFHIMTWLLFPIGMFPFIMILLTLIFFSPDFHIRLIQKFGFFTNALSKAHSNLDKTSEEFRYRTFKPVLCFLIFFFFAQVLLPWRYLLYPGELFWTEEGYRFSWRVMLMEKAGYVIFHVEDSETGGADEVFGSDYLTPNQEKMMSTQPDMILQFAHFIRDEYKKKGIKDPVVRAEAYVTLNGRGSRLFLNPEVNLAAVEEGLHHKSWILSYNE